MKSEVAEKRVLVFGLGLHGGGAAVVRWLCRQGASVTVTDLRASKVLQPTLRLLRNFPVTYVLGKHRYQDIDQADLIIKNPGVPTDSPYLIYARDQGIPLETDVSLFVRRHHGPIYGVTGTKGKTTTAALLWRMIRRQKPRAILAGTAGISALSKLSRLRKADPVVLELSSWQLEDLAYHRWSPSISVITNIHQDHLNRHRTMREYVKAKSVILRFQRRSDAAVLNYDNARVRSLSKVGKGHRLWFSAHTHAPAEGIILRNDSAYYVKSKSTRYLFSKDDVKLLGSHNLENVLAASAAALSAGVTPSHIRWAVRHFRGIPHRMELVRTVSGVRYINDTAATTPDAALAGLRAIPEISVVIAGGADKKLNFTRYVNYLSHYVPYVILLPGTATDKMVKHFQRLKKRVRKASTMAIAVRLASLHAQPGTTVSLSPGCASFGLFLHEFDRGEQFVDEVKRL